MFSRSLSIALAAAVVAALQVATPAKAETWSFFPWFSPAAPEKPRVTSRIEQPAPLQVAPVQTAAPRVIRPTRIEPTPVVAETPRVGSPFNRPYMIVGLGL
jgi:hypothetical protein